MGSARRSKDSKPRSEKPKAPPKPRPSQGEAGELPQGKLALIRDPRVYARKLPLVLPPYKRILGLDLSSTAGTAFCDIIPGQPVTRAPIIGGQWNLDIGQYDTNSIRFIRLKQFLYLTAPDLIIYEEVKFVGQTPVSIGGKPINWTAAVARAVTGAQLVHSLSAILVTWADENNVPCQSVPVATLKRYATGSGNAKKEDMIAAANKEFGTEFVAADYEKTGVDNIVDAMFLCKFGVHNYSEGLNGSLGSPPAETAGGSAEPVGLAIEHSGGEPQGLSDDVPPPG